MVQSILGFHRREPAWQTGWCPCNVPNMQFDAILAVALPLSVVWFAVVLPRVRIGRALQGDPAREAAGLGLDYSGTVSLLDSDWPVGVFRRGFRMRALHGMSGQYRGRDVRMIQIEHWGYHTSVIRRYRIWCAALRIPAASTGAMWIQGKRLAWGDTLHGRYLRALEPELDWGSRYPTQDALFPPACAQRFVVRGDTDVARRLLQPRLLERLAGFDDTFNIWIEGEWLLVFRERYPTREIRHLLDTGLEALSVLGT